MLYFSPWLLTFVAIMCICVRNACIDCISFSHRYSSIIISPVTDDNSRPQQRQANNSENCICVLHYLCDRNYNIKTGGEEIIDERIGPNDPPLTPCPPGQLCCIPPPGAQVSPTPAPATTARPTPPPTTLPPTTVPPTTQPPTTLPATTLPATTRPPTTVPPTTLPPTTLPPTTRPPTTAPPTTAPPTTLPPTTLPPTTPTTPRPTSPPTTPTPATIPTVPPTPPPTTLPPTTARPVVNATTPTTNAAMNGTTAATTAVNATSAASSTPIPPVIFPTTLPPPVSTTRAPVVFPPTNQSTISPSTLPRINDTVIVLPSSTNLPVMTIPTAPPSGITIGTTSAVTLTTAVPVVTTRPTVPSNLTTVPTVLPPTTPTVTTRPPMTIPTVLPPQTIPTVPPMTIPTVLPPQTIPTVPPMTIPTVLPPQTIPTVPPTVPMTTMSPPPTMATVPPMTIPTVPPPQTTPTGTPPTTTPTATTRPQNATTSVPGSSTLPPPSVPPIIFPTNAPPTTQPAPTMPPVVFPTTPQIIFPTNPTTSLATTPPPVTTVRPPTPGPPGSQCGVQYIQTSTQETLDPVSARFAEFPWMLAVLDSTALSIDGTIIRNAYLCGASLIRNNIAMTAAHCIRNQTAQNLIIRAGELNTLFANEPLPHQDRTVSRIIEIHRDFNRSTLYNDIALLRMEEPVVFANNVVPICLPTMDQKFVGSTCIATGWGKSAFGPPGRFQSTMRKVTLNVISNESCQTKLQRTRLSTYFRLHPSFLCAGGIENQDTCTGDGGGPLVCRTPGGTWVQAGIVSWGIGCGMNDVPGVYVDVASFVGWINSTILRMNMDTLPRFASA